MKLKKPWKPLASLSIAVLAVVGFAPVAMADTFTPMAEPPTVTINSTPGGALTKMLPGDPYSLASYEVDATVTSQGTVGNLSTVTMCWYVESGSSDCTGTDPRYEFKMTWTQSDEIFSVNGTNEYQNATSSIVGASTDLSVELKFKFNVSSAMFASNAWKVHVVALDRALTPQSSETSDPVAGPDYKSNLIVDYFGAVTAPRLAQSFGEIAAGTSSDVPNATTGEFKANGASDISMSASTFTDDYSHTLGFFTGAYDGVSIKPGVGEVYFACSPGATVIAATALSTSPVSVDANKFALGTTETADSSLKHSCRLAYGGGATQANTAYSSTVVVAIGAHD